MFAASKSRASNPCQGKVPYLLVDSEAIADVGGEKFDTPNGTPRVSYRSTLIQTIFASVVLLVGALASVWCYSGYVRGTAIADAAIQGYFSHDSFDLGELGASLSARAGRTPAVVSTGETSDLQSAVNEAVATTRTMLDQNDVEMERIVNDIIMNKTTRILSAQQRSLNAEIPELVGAKVRSAKLPQTKELTVESIHGAESSWIDTLECYSVDSDVTTGQAVVQLKLKASTPWLGVRGHANPVQVGRSIHFKLNVNHLDVRADGITGVVQFTNQKMTSLDTGYVSAHVHSLDGTCYQKYDHSKTDPLCTTFMNRKLRNDKNAIMHKISRKITSDAQTTVNKMLPITLPSTSQVADV